MEMIIKDYSKFYLLDTISGPGGTIHLECIDGHCIDGKCVRGYDLFSGNVDVKAPLIFEVFAGRYFRDVLGTTWGVVDIFRERIADALEEGGFTGWRRYPVIVHDRKGKEVPGYCGISITGRGGGPDDSRAEQVILPPVVERGPTQPGLKGYFLEGDYYDGSDLFVPGETARIVMTERVRNVLVADRSLKLNLVPLSEDIRINWERVREHLKKIREKNL